LEYGKSAGLYDETVCCNLNERESGQFDQVVHAMSQADILLSTAALVYLDIETIEALVSSFAKGDGMNKEGYVLVNFLNPFALEKSDETKRILLKHFICGTKMTGIQYSLLYKAPFYSKYDNFSIGKISFQCIPTGISVGGFCKSGTL